MRVLHAFSLATCAALLGACGDEPSGASNVGPTAAFTVHCVEFDCTLVNASSDADGTIETYEWSFGDLEAAATRDAVHRYAEAGRFTVRLLVIDDDGWSATASQAVDVVGNTRPTARLSYAWSDLTCQFTDQSADAGGRVVGYRWDFGDHSGVETIRSPWHKYAAEGQYIATLTVTDDEGATAATTAAVAVREGSNLAPTARFTLTCTDLTCAFRDESSDADGRVTARLWDFSDGEPSTDANPVHTFAAAGLHTVRLTVTDNRGGTGSVSSLIRVGPPPPQPIAAFSPACSGLACTFTNERHGGTLDAMWDFGDGQTSSEWSPTHVYDVTEPTTFTVTLTVSDFDVSYGSTSLTITVTP